ncbi:MAG: S-layer homology domain-containing protein, partial [Clostridiales bacterium]|nr:S-layer homology domain-containing protein [Clostridiales bacterium]
MKRKRLLSVLLALCMLSTLVPAVAALSFSDMPNDYSTVALQAAIDNGLLNGSDGKILPNDYLTRAQMATIIVRAFGATNEASLAGFSDVTGEEWYAPYLAKAVYMKVLQGDGTRLMPTDPITRQQVFTILARALKLEDGTRADLAAFSDASSVAPWAVGPTAALVKAGFIHGSDGKLNPTANILRKDFAVVMHNIFKKYITQPGTVTELPEGCVLINVPGVTLKNVTVKGDLVIGDGVGDGDVILENVTITGRMVVRGGGLSSIIIRGSSSVGTVIVSKVDGNVRVFVEDGADVEVVYIDDGKDDVIVEGEVDKLVVSASDVPVTIKGTVDEVTVSGAKATITVDGEVGTLTTTSSATNTAVIVNDGANVDTVNANAAGTSVSGDGSVGSVNAAANNVNVSTVGTNVTAAPGVSGVKAGDKEVKPGETAKVEQGTTPGTGGGGGGGFPIGGGGAGPEEPAIIA